MNDLLDAFLAEHVMGWKRCAACTAGECEGCDCPIWQDDDGLWHVTDPRNGLSWRPIWVAGQRDEVVAAMMAKGYRVMLAARGGNYACLCSPEGGEGACEEADTPGVAFALAAQAVIRKSQPEGLNLEGK